MCTEQCQCINPQRLVGIKKECSPEQIKECHGETTSHPCVEENKEPDKEARG